MILNIAKQLIENEFTPMLKTTGRDIFCGGRQIGPCLYCVIAVDADSPDYKQRFEQMAGYLGASYSVQDFTLVILGVFAAGEVTDELKEYTHVDAEIFEKVNILKWVLTPNGIEVFGKQPTKLINLRQILESSLETNTTAQSMSDILEENAEKRRAMIVSRDTLFTFLLMAVIVVVFIAQLFDRDETMIADLGMHPIREGQLYRAFTSIFLHSGIEHVISNLFGLYIFGSRTERYFGKAKFLAVFFIGGILAGLTSALFLDGLAIGASGAVFALMGAVTAYGFKTKRSVDGFDLYFLLFFALIGLVGGAIYPNVDNIAHLSGFVYGVIMGLMHIPENAKK